MTYERDMADRIEGTYETSYHSLMLAESFLRTRGIIVNTDTIRRYWQQRGWAVKSKAQVMEERIKHHYESCNGFLDEIRTQLAEDLQRIDPHFHMGREHLKSKIKSLGLIPKRSAHKKRKKEEDEQDENIRKKVEENGLSASDFLRHPRRKSPARGYEFCENPDNI